MKQQSLCRYKIISFPKIHKTTSFPSAHQASRPSTSLLGQ